MRSSKYILWQDDNGWRGYIQGYPEYEAQGESFEELQAKLWQLHQELTVQHRDQGVLQDQHAYQPNELNQHQPSHGHAHGHTYNHTPTLPRPISRAQNKRRARVEELMFALISNR